MEILWELFRTVKGPEYYLWEAANKGKVEKAMEILSDPSNSAININWRNEGEAGWTPLHVACAHGHDGIVAILLALPGIDVNVKNNGDGTPFQLACGHGSTACVRLMLRDLRVRVNEIDRDERSPLWWAARFGHFVIVKWWIASGREMNLGPETGLRDTDPLTVAKEITRSDSETKKNEASNLLERFKENPVRTRHAVRIELGCQDELVAEVLALVVFLSDGLLSVKDSNEKAARFFKIASQLPLELQTVLCHRVIGSAKEIISGRDSEVAFRELANTLQPVETAD